MKKNIILSLLAAVASFSFTSCAQSYSERYSSKAGMQERSQSSTFAPLAGMVGVNVNFFPPQGGGYRQPYGGGYGCAPQRPQYGGGYGRQRPYPPQMSCPSPRYGRGQRQVQQRPYYGSSANPIRMGYAQFSDQNPGGYW